MPFPTTGIIDNFNRANEGPPPTGWSAWSTTGFTVGIGGETNVLAPNGAVSCDNYYSTSMTNQNVECYITCTTLPVSGGGSLLFARTNPTAGGGGSGDGYAIVHDVSSGTDTISLRRYDVSVGTTLNSWSQDLAAGDAIGIRCSSSNIEAWVRVSSSWSRLGMVSDATHSGAAPKNKLGLFYFANGSSVGRYDDFGGGNYSLPTIVPVTHGGVWRS